MDTSRSTGRRPEFVHSLYEHDGNYISVRKGKLQCGALKTANTRNQSSSICIIRIVFLESYARILTYETLSYVNHIVAWYFRSVHGSSSLDFNHETFTQNRNSFTKSNTPLLSVYLKQIFLGISVEGLLFYAVCWLLPTFFGSATPPPGTDASLWRPSVWTLSFLPTCVIIRVFNFFNNTHVF